MDNQKGKRYMRYFGYGIGAVGLDLSYGLFYSFLANYLTDVLMMPALFLLILTPLARIWDGINDPMMGTIVDNTRTRFGKFRPWIMTGACLNAVVLTLLFTNPGLEIGSVSLYVYVAVMYVLWGMTNTMADIPYWSMVPSFTNDPKERNMVATIARAFSGFGQILVVVLTVSMVKLLGDGTETSPQGFSRWAMISGCILIFVAFITFMSTKEKNDVRKAEKFSFKKAYNTIKSNDQLLIFMLFAILSNTGWYMTTGLGMYYFKVVVGDSGKMGTFGVFTGAGQALGLLLIPILTKFMPRRRVIQIALCIAAFGYAGMFLFGHLTGNFIIFAIFAVIGSIGIGCMFVSQTIMLADIVDYGEYKNGIRSESITFSMKGFLQKMAYTLQTIIMFTGLGLSQYDGSLATANSDLSKNTITGMMFIVPAVLIVASLIIFTKKYKLDQAKMEEVNRVLAERQKLEAAAE